MDQLKNASNLGPTFNYFDRSDLVITSSAIQLQRSRRPLHEPWYMIIIHYKRGHMYTQMA